MNTGHRTMVITINSRIRLFLSLLVLLTAIAAPAYSLEEFRGFWVDAWGAGFLSQSQVDTLLGVPGTSIKGQIREANCNAIVMQVRRNCDANYPSSMGEPYMSGLSPSNFNALQAVINAAHDTTGGKQRIEVHAWIVAFRTSGGAVYAAHSSTPTGSLTNLDNYWPSRDSSGAEVSDKAFDPGHPLVEEYTVNVAMDLVNNFDIDGIHYDYIRFTANNQGYNPTSIARYNARYGLSGQPASTSEQFKQWRRDQVTAVVRKVYAKIQSSKPWVKQSGSFVTWNPSPTASTRAAFQNTRPYYDVYSDWDSWLQEGIVDAAIPMTYYNWASLPSDYTKWMNFEKDRHGNRHMYIGPGIYLNSLSNAILELQQTRDPSPAGNYAQGFCGYSYRTPYSGGSWAGFAPSLLAQVTPTQATIPAMPWKTSPTKGHISGTVTYASSGAWADGATVSITGPESRSQICDGTGFYSFIDLTPGTYNITASKSGYPSVTSSAAVAVGVVTGNMYIRDMALGGPIITNVQATSITNNTATITWTTDQAASSVVHYGQTTSYGSTQSVAGNVTSHSVTLTGLLPSTLYNFKVTSANGGGSTDSANYTFTTTGPLTITNVQSSNVTATSATITWSTNLAASSQVRYGLTSGYGLQTTLDPAQVLSHSVLVSGLSPNTTYHYQAMSADLSGTVSSNDYTFKTAGPPVISAVASSNVGSTTATITWTTDVPADSQVEYGTDTSYGNTTTLDSNQVTSHSVLVSGLSPSTPYHFRVRSANGAGTTYSGDNTFTTIAFVSEIVIDNLDPEWANTSPSGAWTVGSSASVPKINTNYLYTAGIGDTSEDAATRKCTWTPNIEAAGLYDVYVYYQIGANRTGSAPYKVVYSGGTVTSIQNQYSSTPNQGGWFLIGQDLPFAVGTSGYVQLSNNTSDTALVSADAAKFVYKSGDNTPPSVPTNLVGSAVSTTSIQLNWTPSTDNTAVAGYKIYRNGIQIGTSTTASFLDSTGLAASTTYSYQVSAYDAIPNESAKGTGITKATLSIPPTSSNVTCGRSAGVWYPANGFTFTAVGGFTSGTVYAYRYAWDSSPTHTFNGSEMVWSSGNLTLQAPSDGSFYLHVKGYNSEAVANGEAHLGPYRFDGSAPTLTSVTGDKYTTSTNALNVSWVGDDQESGIQQWEYSVGTTQGAIDKKGWTANGTSDTAVISGLSLDAGSTYFINVRGVNNAGSTGSVLSSSGVTVAYPVDSIGHAKGYADNTPIALAFKPVSAIFNGFFYLSEVNRSSGIRVLDAQTVALGQMKQVSGRLTLLNGCERALTDCMISPEGTLSTANLLVRMPISKVGGGAFNSYTPGVTGGTGLNNIGLFVWVEGKVASLAAGGFYLDDGSHRANATGNTGVKVITSTVHSIGDPVWVKGISSCEPDGSDVWPVILAVDVQPLY